MEVSREQRAAGALNLSLAGLQAGMAAVLLMLAWLGLSAEWRQSSFWTPENLWASTFYGAAAIHRGFSTSTLSGLALYLLVYSVLGGIFATAIRGTVRPFRLVLLGLLVAVSWYYLSFRLIWHAVSPLVWLLHAERPTLFGHVIYGVAVSQFARYLPLRVADPVVEITAIAAVADSGPAV
jgi:hypothetical protein